MSRMYADELLDLGRMEITDKVIDAQNLIRADEKMIEALIEKRGDINLTIEERRENDREIIRMRNRIKLNKIIIEKSSTYEECIVLLTKIMDERQAQNP